MTSAVLLVSSGVVHPNWLARRRLARFLHRLPGFHIQTTASLESIPDLPLDNFKGIVLYVHHKHISQQALACLEDFVFGGGGFLALHSASASFKGQSRYFDLLGGRFTAHGPINEFQVLPARSASATFAGLKGFSVRDELYRHEYNPDNEIQLYTPESGLNEPVAWTRNHGRGRVFYCSLGHTAGTLLLAPFHAVIQQALGWTAGSEPGKGNSSP
jgi:uncharacterized protein